MSRFLTLVLFGLLSIAAAADAQNYTCPFATTTTPGCLKVDGSTITISPTTGIASATTSGSGNVSGPASAVANNIAGYNGTTGKIILDSGIAASNVQLITGMASPPSIGNTTPNSGFFTSLAASGTISGAGFTNYFSAPPPIGSSIPGTGAFTTLSASGAVSGAGFTSLFASPPALGTTAPAAVAATTLSASGAVSGTGFTNLFASPPALGTTAPAAVNASVITRSLPNDGTTGTTQFLLAKLTGAGNAIKATTSDTGGVILGAVQSASATTGNAQIAVAGQATCTFDGATTQDDFVQVSTTAAANCHDTGSVSFPTTGGQVLGRVLSTHASGGNYIYDSFGPGIVPSSGGGGTLVFTDITKTGSYTLNATTDVGGHFNNNGATGTVPLTLPAGSAGLNYCFADVVSGQAITVTAPSGVTISVGEIHSGAAGILTLPTSNDTQCLEWQVSGWLAYAGSGAWSLQ